MARLLTQALHLRHSLLRRPLLPPYLTQAHRAGSFRSGKAELIEIEVEPSPSSSPSDSEKLMLKKLDDIVQTIVVQRATPDWLPFVPGSSFWVPPRHAPLKVADLIGKLANQLTFEEILSVATDRGWPCSQFFINGGIGTAETREVDTEAEGSTPIEVEVEVKVLTDSQKSSRCEDD
ncbi:uncharacterized protein LOC125469863 [Pyrus x bretschneideri]|uniref:uncharacterized protein LOC125469863 n=1 Tax=Pyrus x bretschneideri TaxID=225117 RepID=UPI00202F8426|nr:uncharacterized protein LOC125469863 [Pyrus x bretschneideri]XP_048423855.1 uncharacterized protein LOC125469863 [Pyrus x bretschneideri]XP_048423856.1 uncharacterized protein LOC125469863 [Pyrus x bretschneideri]XP_048423857.1 uncharacterized protein LOC125469863 [Pyrus x bretschneideri]XP_048423858.1 uncharacterized protein LOC125469863 [Pyrus x bretschneideri]XP_048423859.1 uncharacterized protein LOC125469863 [Pyrus x bretschneideri]